ncbi:MAG TPA: lipoprotein [Pseudolabrys sp.]|nr:lipoprotein [Pseudolabrys sp.]
MTHFSGRPFVRLALIGALAAALGLAGCGRKGPLDPPPSASAAGEAAEAPSGLLSPLGPHTVQSNSGVSPGVTTSGQPIAPKGPKKHIPLDVLLD